MTFSPSDDNELECTSQVKHSIMVTDDEPLQRMIQTHPTTIAGGSQDTCE